MLTQIILLAALNYLPLTEADSIHNPSFSTKSGFCISRKFDKKKGSFNVYLAKNDSKKIRHLMLLPPHPMDHGADDLIFENDTQIIALINVTATNYEPFFIRYCKDKYSLLSKKGFEGRLGGKHVISIKTSLMGIIYAPDAEQIAVNSYMYHFTKDGLTFGGVQNSVKDISADTSSYFLLEHGFKGQSNYKLTRHIFPPKIIDGNWNLSYDDILE